MNYSAYKQLIGYLIPYSITVSSLYLFGYWGSFGINIYEYISLYDVIKIAIYQLTKYGAGIIFGVVIAWLFFLPIIRKLAKYNSTNDGDDKDIFGAMSWRVFFIPMFMLSVYVALFIDSPSRWLVASFLFVPVVSVFANKINILSNLIGDSLVRATVTNIFLLILLMSYGWGTVDALSHKKSDNTVIINGDQTENIYIGKAGGYIFLWNGKDKMVEVVLSNEITSMKFSVGADVSLISRLFPDDKRN